MAASTTMKVMVMVMVMAVAMMMAMATVMTRRIGIGDLEVTHVIEDCGSQSSQQVLPAASTASVMCTVILIHASPSSLQKLSLS
jgi:hypothetical protein